VQADGTHEIQRSIKGLGNVNLIFLRQRNPAGHPVDAAELSALDAADEDKRLPKAEFLDDKIKQFLTLLPGRGPEPKYRDSTTG